MHRTLGNIGIAIGFSLALGGAGCKKDSASTSGPSTSSTSAPATGGSVLSDPGKLTEKAPAVYKARMSTTKGEFTIEVHREWAENGADRFYNLVKSGYYTDVAFFRVIKGFMVQFGISGDPALNTVWRSARIPDDAPVGKTNSRGMVSFATSGPNTRTVQLFINYGNNGNLDSMGFTPIGEVTEGMDVVDALNGEYGEGQPGGRGPAQGLFQAQGNTYLKAQFPNLDYIKSAKIL